MKTYVCHIFDGEFTKRKTVTDVTEENFQAAIAYWFLGTGSLSLGRFRENGVVVTVVGLCDAEGSVRGCWEISESYSTTRDCCECSCYSCDWRFSCCCEVCENCYDCVCCCGCDEDD